MQCSYYYAYPIVYYHIDEKSPTRYALSSGIAALHTNGQRGLLGLWEPFYTAFSHTGRTAQQRRAKIGPSTPAHKLSALPVFLVGTRRQRAAQPHAVTGRLCTPFGLARRLLFESIVRQLLPRPADAQSTASMPRLRPALRKQLYRATRVLLLFLSLLV